MNGADHEHGYVLVPKQWLRNLEMSQQRIESALGIVITKENKIMTDQEHMDEDVQEIGAGLDEIVAEIAALKSQPGATAMDFTGLDAVLARVQGVATDNAPAPIEPAPPADGSGDGSVPPPAADAGTDTPAE